ncbi:hypothetical protein E4T47_07171 [Aureobasidium subglaciale]|nr:hypothetical protein E4T47_07171 [Aureobasidium subglaciale]
MSSNFQNFFVADFTGGKVPDYKIVTTKAKRESKRKESKSKKDVSFPFMDLPPEIRTMIYKLLLEESLTELNFITQLGTQKLQRGHLQKRPPTSRATKGLDIIRPRAKDKDITRFHPAILRVSKFIHAEALSILYRQPFYFEHPVAMKQFLLVIHSTNRLLVERIILRGWDWQCVKSWRDALEPAFDRLVSARNLKSLRLERRVQSNNEGVLDRTHLPLEYQIYPPNRFVHAAKFWAQSLDEVKGKGTASSILSFSDINFGSKDEIAQKEKKFLARKKVFFDHLKFD